MSLFQNTREFGSLIGLLLLVYATNIAIEVLRVQHLDPSGSLSARLPHTGLATLFSFASLPCILWPAIYVGGYDGWLAAVVAWLVFQVMGALATLWLGIRGTLLPLHLLHGLVALPVGYYLTLTTAPWGAH